MTTPEETLDIDADSTGSSTSPDCAVGAFSDTFSLPFQQPCHPIVLNTPAIKTSGRIVTSVPAEVLLIIFKLVHHWHEDHHSRSRSDAFWPSKEDILSPSLFPYSVAAVCPYWRDVMALVPEFWTTIVILVDQRATPLPAVESQLAWSRDLPLDVAVTRRMDTYTAKDKDESVRTHQIISRLLPHIHRFRNLSFDVMLSSSLPSFPHDFKGSAPLLRCLKLECTEDDGYIAPEDAQNKVTASTTPVTQTEQEGFQCPALRRLTIDGRNFYNAGRMGPSWSGMLSGVQSFTISHFKPSDGETLTICDFMLSLKSMQHLLDLNIVDLSITLSESPRASYQDVNDVNLPELESISLCDVVESLDPHNPGCSRLLDTILNAVGSELKATYITRCAISPVQEFGGSLKLTDIKGNIIPFLQSWDGKELWVSSCPGFDDNTLKNMHWEAWYSCALNIRTLLISDCPNISAAGLKRFVRDRRSDLDRQPPLKKLFLTSNVPYISPKDRVWFSNKLRRFGYRGPEIDGDQDQDSTVDQDGSGDDSDVYTSDEWSDASVQWDI